MATKIKAISHQINIVSLKPLGYTLEQLREAMEIGVDAVLLDNMTPAQLREAVMIVGGRALTEASGGITPDSAAEITATGVDLISVGWITHSAPILDIGLDYVSEGQVRGHSE